METSFTINQDLTFKESMSSTLYYILSSKRFRLFVLFLVGLTVMSNLLSPQGIEPKKILWGLASIFMTGTILLLFMAILSLVFRKTRPSIFKISYHFTHWGMSGIIMKKNSQNRGKRLILSRNRKLFSFYILTSIMYMLFKKDYLRTSMMFLRSEIC